MIIDNTGIVIGGALAILVAGCIAAVICLKKKKPGGHWINEDKASMMQQI